MGKKIAVEKSDDATVNAGNARDKELMTLAALLINAAAGSTPIATIATGLRVSAIAVYKWVNGAPVSVPMAFIVVTTMQHRIGEITNKKKRDQAKRLLASVTPDMARQV